VGCLSDPPAFVPSLAASRCFHGDSVSDSSRCSRFQAANAERYGSKYTDFEMGTPVRSRAWRLEAGHRERSETESPWKQPAAAKDGTNAGGSEQTTHMILVMVPSCQ